MNFKTFIGTLLVSSTLTLSATALEDIDKMVAQVEEGVVLKSELDRKIAQAKQQILSRGGQLPSDKVLHDELLEQLILQSIQLQMAERAGIQVSDAELEHFIGQIAAGNQMSPTEFRLKLAQDGMPYELFLADIRTEIATQRVREGMVARRIQVSEKEVDSLVKAIDSKNKIEYHLGHILLQVPEHSDEDTLEQIKAKAIGITHALKAGDDFATTAANVSDSPDAAQGGNFGWRTEESMPTLFADLVIYMKTGEISSVIRSPSGFHILKLFEKRGEQQHMVSQVSARHILIRPDAIISEEEAFNLLVKLKSQIEANEVDFGDVAKKHSVDPGSSNLGGDLGWRSPNIYDPAFKDALTSLSVNQISQPFKSDIGWHIVQLLGHRQDDQTQEMKKEQALGVLRQRKFTEEVDNWLREIRDEAFVQKLVEEDES